MNRNRIYVVILVLWKTAGEAANLKLNNALLHDWVIGTNVGLTDRKSLWINYAVVVNMLGSVQNIITFSHTTLSMMMLTSIILIACFDLMPSVFLGRLHKGSKFVFPIWNRCVCYIWNIESEQCNENIPNNVVRRVGLKRWLLHDYSSVHVVELSLTVLYKVPALIIGEDLGNISTWMSPMTMMLLYQIQNTKSVDLLYKCPPFNVSWSPPSSNTKFLMLNHRFNNIVLST